MKLLLAGAAALTLAGCSPFAEVATLRFEVNVELVIDGAVATGEGVWEAHFVEKVGALTTVGGIRTEVSADAIPVELSTGDVVYVLRRSANAPTEPGYGAYISHCNEGSFTSFREQILSLQKFAGGCRLPGAEPMVVSVTLEEDVPRIAILRYENQKPIPEVIADKVTLDPREVERITISVRSTDAAITRPLAGQPWVSELPKVGLDSAFIDFHQEDFTAEFRR